MGVLILILTKEVIMLNYNRSAGAKLIITGVFISNAISGMNLMRMRALAGIAGRSQNFTSTGPLHLSAQNTQAMRLGSLSQNNFAQRLLQSAGSYNNDYSWKNNRQTNQTNHSWFGRLCFALGFGAAYATYQTTQNKTVFAQEKEGVENIHSPKAYAKSLFSGEQGRCYSCNEFLNFAHYRDGSYFEPEDRERYYTECAESYPRAAEASILKLFQSPFGEAEAYEYIALLTNKNFEFSPEFKAAVTRQLNASMGKIIDSVVFEAKNINGKTIDIFDEIEYKQRRPNCEEMETFVKEYGSDELAKQIMPLCALKKQFAPPLIPR